MSELSVKRGTGQFENIDYGAETITRGQWAEEQEKATQAQQAVMGVANIKDSTQEDSSVSPNEQLKIILSEEYRDDWRQLAACKNAPPDLFFAPLIERKDERIEREYLAKKVCASCMVRGSCLDESLAIHETSGIWGGLNEEERRGLRRS